MFLLYIECCAAARAYFGLRKQQTALLTEVVCEFLIDFCQYALLDAQFCFLSPTANQCFVHFASHFVSIVELFAHWTTAGGSKMVPASFDMSHRTALCRGAVSVDVFHAILIPGIATYQLRQLQVKDLIRST